MLPVLGLRSLLLELLVLRALRLLQLFRLQLLLQVLHLRARLLAAS